MTTLFLLEVDNQQRQLPEEVAWGRLRRLPPFFWLPPKLWWLHFQERGRIDQNGAKVALANAHTAKFSSLSFDLSGCDRYFRSFHKFINDGGLWNILLVEYGQKVAVGLFSWRRNATIDLVDKGKIVTVHLVALLSSQVLFAIHLIVWLSFYWIHGRIHKQ